MQRYKRNAEVYVFRVLTVNTSEMPDLGPGMAFRPALVAKITKNAPY